MGPEHGTRRRGWRTALWIAAAAIVLVAAFVGTGIATDASSFCKTCHEMEPYYAAWKAGAHGHEDVACIDCHVDPGLAARLAHKPVALLEVWAHFFGNTHFPLATPPEVPNARCRRCHDSVKVDRKNFSHDLHASKGSCRNCHPAAGHAVDIQALKDAGIFNPDVSVAPFALSVAVVNGGTANLPGHVAVVCSTCHDLNATGCRACHVPPAKHTSAAETRQCSDCHRPGPKFVFSHPGAGECTDCHKVPAIHPVNAKGKACPACHQPGASWKFSHPTGSANCTNCHRVPAKHPTIPSGRPCSICHVPGRSWGFSHAAAGASCADCHARPASHFAGACSSCHVRPGVSWAFSHPAAGEHSWKSFACAKCHPNGTRTYFCTCHNGRPPTDD